MALFVVYWFVLSQRGNKKLFRYIRIDRSWRSRVVTHVSSREIIINGKNRTRWRNFFSARSSSFFRVLRFFFSLLRPATSSRRDISLPHVPRNNKVELLPLHLSFVPRAFFPSLTPFFLSYFSPLLWSLSVLLCSSATSSTSLSLRRKRFSRARLCLARNKLSVVGGEKEKNPSSPPWRARESSPVTQNNSPPYGRMPYGISRATHSR